MKNPAVYIMANAKNGTIYTGVTSDLIRRVYEHKNEVKSGFAGKYNCKKLVYFEMLDTIDAAILREKQVKRYLRKRKLAIISSFNPEWRDLYCDIL